MSTTALVPVEEYLRLTGKPYREYRGGVLYPKPMPAWSHGIIQSVLAALLRKPGLHVGSEISVRISAEKILIPDVIVARSVQEPYPTEPVLLCCEILSPEDRIGAILAKCEEYHAWGVPFCWVIDPGKRAAWEYPSGGEPLRATGALRAGDIAVALDELFAVLDTSP